METNRWEVRWLIALEAMLFLSLPCWESAAIWIPPVGHPLRFGVTLTLSAAIATFSCHVGPGLFASRFGTRRPRLVWVFLIWLAVGYVDWLGTLARAEADLTGVVWPANLGAGSWRVIAVALPIAFLAVVTMAVCVRSWWKYAVVIGLPLGLGILVWALAATWNGLWIRDRYFPYDRIDWSFIRDFDELDWAFAKGILLSAAPAMVVGWRVGQIEPRPARIWMSGFAGIWLPLVLSVTVASMATQAGVNLYYRPSLPRGFNWALLGRHGQLEASVIIFTLLTLFSPALVSAFSLREIVPEWGRRFKSRLVVPALICAVSLMIWLLSALIKYVASLLGGLVRNVAFFFFSLGSSGSEGISSIFGSPFHNFWGWSLIFIGATVGLGWFVSPHRAELVSQLKRTAK